MTPDQAHDLKRQADEFLRFEAGKERHNRRPQPVTVADLKTRHRRRRERWRLQMIARGRG